MVGAVSGPTSEGRRIDIGLANIFLCLIVCNVE